jgi:hypothetical protein
VSADRTCISAPHCTPRCHPPRSAGETIGLADRGSRPWPPGAHGARNRSNHHYHWDRLEGTGKAALRTAIRTASQSMLAQHADTARRGKADPGDGAIREGNHADRIVMHGGPNRVGRSVNRCPSPLFTDRLDDVLDLLTVHRANTARRGKSGVALRVLRCLPPRRRAARAIRDFPPWVKGVRSRFCVLAPDPFPRGSESGCAGRLLRPTSLWVSGFPGSRSWYVFRWCRTCFIGGCGLPQCLSNEEITRSPNSPIPSDIPPRAPSATHLSECCVFHQGNIELRIA